MAGAASSGYEPQAWQQLGFAIGEAFQVADDLRDVAGSAERTGQARAPGRGQPAPQFRGQTGLRRRHGAFRGSAGGGPWRPFRPAPAREQLGQQITGVSRSLVTGLSSPHRRRLRWGLPGRAFDPGVAAETAFWLSPLPEICRCLSAIQARKPAALAPALRSSGGLCLFPGPLCHGKARPDRDAGTTRPLDRRHRRPPRLARARRGTAAQGRGVPGNPGADQHRRHPGHPRRGSCGQSMDRPVHHPPSPAL